MTEEPTGPTAPTSAPRRSNSGAAVLGAILIVVGAAFFIGRYLDLDWGDAAWPFYVIVPGLLLLAIGLTQTHGPGLAIGGSIVTIVGLILFYQNVTDHWESWAYAWALVGPGGSGVGMFLFGSRSANGGMVRAGLWQIMTALAIFGVGFVFFEGVLGISGRRFLIADWVMPVLLIGLGAVVLVRAAFSGRDHRDEGAGGAG